MTSGRQGTPFPFEGPVQPDLLIDRREELQLLGRRAGDRVNVRLVAPRRYGKTSLLLAHAAELRETGWRTVHVDFARVADLTDVARRIASAYASLDNSWVRAHLTGLLARVGVSVSPAGPALSVGPRPTRPDAEAAESVMLSLLDLPKTLWERDQVSTLVVLDEFQDLLVARKNLDGLLRSRLQYHGDAAAYVYAGSEPSMMRELFDSRERPFFGQADPITLSPLPVGDVISELAARFAAEGTDSADALAPLCIFAGGHPQRSMLLAYLLQDALTDGAEPTPATADAVIDRAIERTAPAHRALWDASSVTDRVVLAAIADGVAPMAHKLAAEHNVARTTLGAAAQRLADQGHVVRDDHGDARLVDPLLAEWLRRR